MSNSLEDLKNNTARSAFGMTRHEAHAAGICISCKQPPRFYSVEGRKEYGITGLCEYCFDLICDPDPCQVCQRPASFHIHKPKMGECEEFRPAPSESIGD